MLGDGTAEVGGADGATVDGAGLVGVLLAVGDTVRLGAGAGALWVQATGPIIHAATNRATRTGRRMLLLDVGPPPGA